MKTQFFLVSDTKTIVVLKKLSRLKNQLSRLWVNTLAFDSPSDFTIIARFIDHCNYNTIIYMFTIEKAWHFELQKTAHSTTNTVNKVNKDIMKLTRPSNLCSMLMMKPNNKNMQENHICVILRHNFKFLFLIYIIYFLT